MALEAFFSSLPEDRLFYLALDELQEIFLISVDGVLSQDDVIRAGVVLKRLLRQRSNVLVAVTGSGMATVWSNILSAPANGRAVYSMLRVLALPSSSPEPAIANAWAWLKAHSISGGVQLPEELLRSSPRNVALLVDSVTDFVKKGAPEDVMEHVRGYERTRLVKETLDDFAVFLREGDSTFRARFAALCDDQVGVDPRDLERLWLGADFLLKPYVKPAAGTSKVFLDAPYHTIIFKTLIDGNGKLDTSKVNNLQYPVAVYHKVAHELKTFGASYKREKASKGPRDAFSDDTLGRELETTMNALLSVMPACWQRTAWIQWLASLQTPEYAAEASATVQRLAEQVTPEARDMADVLYLVHCAVAHRSRLLVEVLDSFPATLEIHRGILSSLSKKPD
ncbi:hypothetical protein KFL_000170520 [Klebsormidium nitens]|uniref:Uncharacterized protein n=1 Tax=Klebsormidium nitens TaxID=105231 RepID=A0A1Y1HQ35_KLENI|nr:hypothetical protein KFL_000170520 [Klebsormidium nitens]|eukprot:GAQ78706.1 hypothetical protein KFL_000170520 [Klebsormidium nitens]